MLKRIEHISLLLITLLVGEGAFASNSGPVCEYVRSKALSEIAVNSPHAWGMSEKYPGFVLTNWRNELVYFLDDKGVKVELSNKSMYIDINGDGERELVVWVYEQAGPEASGEALAIVSGLKQDELDEPLGRDRSIRWIEFREPIFKDAQGVLMSGVTSRPLLFNYNSKPFILFPIVGSSVSEMVVAELGKNLVLEQKCYINNTDIGGE